MQPTCNKFLKKLSTYKLLINNILICVESPTIQTNQFKRKVVYSGTINTKNEATLSKST